jgi:hypothetical protein
MKELCLDYQDSKCLYMLFFREYHLYPYQEEILCRLCVGEKLYLK